MSIPEEHKHGIKRDFRCAVLTISSSRFAKIEQKEYIEDRSGDLIRGILEENSHKVVVYEILPDNESKIKEKVISLVKSDIEVIITTGGTGLASKDVTIEAVSPLIEKEVPGFGELFRLKSYDEVGSAVVLTRALLGIINKKIIFCLPGSPNAVELALKEIIIPEIPHIMRHIRE